jgi:long-chain-fatty-acid--CoA ligase ACSBG
MRGRHVFMGYLRDAKETAKTIDSEGFLHSEDLGRVNKEGVFFVTGRLKEILIPSSGGRVIPIIL